MAESDRLLKEAAQMDPTRAVKETVKSTKSKKAVVAEVVEPAKRKYTKKVTNVA